MGTSAWFYFVFNLTKLPVLLALTALNPARPLLTASTFLFNLSMIPMIALGVLIGRWALPRIPQRLFTHLVLLLAGVAAVRLLFT